MMLSSIGLDFSGQISVKSRLVKYYNLARHFEVMIMNLMSHISYGALFQNDLRCRSRVALVEVIFSSAATTCLVFAANRWGPLTGAGTVVHWSLGWLVGLVFSCEKRDPGNV